MKIHDYGDGKERDRDWEVSVIWETETLTRLKRIERTLRSECHMRDGESDCVTEIIYGLSFNLYKRSNKLNFYIRDGFGYEFWVGTYMYVTRPITVFWSRGKPKPIPKPSQSE